MIHAQQHAFDRIEPSWSVQGPDGEVLRSGDVEESKKEHTSWGVFYSCVEIKDCGWYITVLELDWEIYRAFVSYPMPEVIIEILIQYLRQSGIVMPRPQSNY